MNINSDYSGASVEYLSASRNSEKAAKFSRSTTRQDITNATDIIDISEMYRTYQLQGAEQLANAQNGIWTTSESTKGQFAGTDLTGMRKILAESGMGLDLSSINASRKTLGRRLDDVIKKAGIKLGKDEKLSISIDGNNKVKVSGIKDKKRAEAIEKAIANDDRLSQDIRRHYAQGRVNKDIKTMEQAQSQGLVENASDVFTSRNLRAFVVDDYLQQNAGVSLADLSAEDGVMTGINQDVAALFGEDPELATTVQNILENGEHKLDFSVSFEFQNGTITDSSSEEAAKEKMKAIQGIVMDLVDAHNKLVTDNNAGMSADELSKMRIDSVKISASASGGFEVVGAENMDQSKVDAIMRIVSRALEIYSGADTPEVETLDAYTGGKATGNFADIVETYVESHRLEDFDTEEFPHEVEMELNSFMGKPEVVSPAADKARDEMNEKLGQELGQELRTVLEEEGVNVGSGINVEVDANGKITVIGDLGDPNLQKAQQVLDKFSKGAIGDAFIGTEPEEYEKSDICRLDAPYDYENSSTGNTNEIKRTQYLNNETNPGGTSSPNIAKFERPEYTDRDPQSYAEGKSEAFAARYRDSTRVTTSLSSGSVSRIRAPQFMNNADNMSSVMLPNEGVANDPYESIWNEHKLYGGDATGMFQHMVDSLGRFHDGDRSRKVAFTIM